MNALVLAALLQAAAPAQTDVTLGGFRSVGFTDDESAAYRARLEEQLGAMGVRLVEPATPLGPSCYDELECLQAAPGETAGLLDVELVRVGPFLQVKLRLWDRDAEPLLDEEGMEDAEVFAREGRLVPPSFAERVGASGQPLAGAASPTERIEEITVSTAEEPSALEGMPVLGYTGIGVVVLGGALVLGGGLLALSEMMVLENASSLGGEKERARVLGPSALVAAGVGAVVLGGGGALATMGFAGR